MDHTEDTEDNEDFESGKIYCANCGNCKLVAAPPEGSGFPGNDNRYVLRIRCSHGMWKKKAGEEKLYKYCTITRRCRDECDGYVPMGDTREFIRELRKTVVMRDTVYEVASSYEVG